MNKVKELAGIPVEIISIISLDCKKNRGMWIAYSFLLLGLVAVISAAVLAFVVTYDMMVAMVDKHPTFAHDNPIPLVVWAFIIAATYQMTKDVHNIYRDIRHVIIKGNR